MCVLLDTDLNYTAEWNVATIGTSVSAGVENAGEVLDAEATRWLVKGSEMEEDVGLHWCHLRCSVGRRKGE